MKTCNQLKLVIRLAALCIGLVFSASFGSAQIAVGGNYKLTQSVIAGGGASGPSSSVGGAYQVEGTIGQSAVGNNQQSSPYTFKPGFWTAQTLAPTAAAVPVSGRVVTANGAGIRNVIVTLTSSNGERQTALSSSFGYFRFDRVASGQTCIITVSAKRYQFAQAAIALSIFDALDGVIFTADDRPTF